MQTVRALGIMNGTSLDGIDWVLCRIQKKPLKLTFVKQSSSKFPKELRARLHKAAKRESRVNELSLVHHDLGRFYAREAKRLGLLNADLAGLHGQTVFHQAPDATLQIGEASYLAAAMKKPVVADFRVADLALGGQGAPLATIVHAALFQSLIAKESVAVQNLGGIGNVSYFEKGSIKNLVQARGKKVFSFDTGPANMLIDLAAHEFFGKDYDKFGRIAASGKADLKLVERWMNHRYFRLRPPKSCGREEFGEVFFARALKNMRNMAKADKVATLTEFTAVSVADSYKRHLPDLPRSVFLCGGGAKNDYLKSRIQFHLPKSRVFTTEDVGWPVSAIEGAAFALMAALRLWEIPAHLPETTGASRAALLGKIVRL